MFTQKNQPKPFQQTPHRVAWLTRSPFVDLLRLALRPQNVPADSATAGWIKKHPILAVVGLAYALSWAGLIPLIRDPGLARHADLGQAGNPAVLLYVFIGVLGCLWAALILAGAANGIKGRYNLLRGYLRWRVGFQWYTVVILGPVIVLGVASGLDYLCTGNIPAVAVQTLPPAALVSTYAVFILQYLFGNFEEICWRASVLPRLQARYSALVSSLLVGLLQGLWHWPYLFVNGHYVQSVGLPAIVLQSVAMGVVATWIYNNTRGSLLMVSLFHASYDALSQFQGQDVQLFYLSIGVWCAAAVLLVIVFGAQHLSRKSEAELRLTRITANERAV